MDVNDNAGSLLARSVLATIASNRASTGCSYRGRGLMALPVTRFCLFLKNFKQAIDLDPLPA